MTSCCALCRTCCGQWSSCRRRMGLSLAGGSVLGCTPALRCAGWSRAGSQSSPWWERRSPLVSVQDAARYSYAAESARSPKVRYFQLNRAFSARSIPAYTAVCFCGYFFVLTVLIAILPFSAIPADFGTCHVCTCQHCHSGAAGFVQP